MRMSALSHKMRGAAERFIADKARIAGILNSLKNDPLCVCVCVCVCIKTAHRRIIR